MKKNIVILTLFLFILSSCGSDSTSDEVAQWENKNICNDEFQIQAGTVKSVNLKAKVITSDVKNILSNNAGNIEYLACENGMKVEENTLIAKITPDSSDPNIQNLVNQKNMIVAQIANTQGIISSTKSNFTTQANSLNIQKQNAQAQLKILNDSLSKISLSGDFWVSDIDKQLDALQIQYNTLETQIKDLQTLKQKTESSKKSDWEKIALNIQNTRKQIGSLLWNFLTQADEVFSISQTNKNSNINFEIYLWAKNSKLKTQVESEWKELNMKNENISTFSDEQISDILQSVDNLAQNIKQVMKDSVSSPTFPQSVIDTYYSLFNDFWSGALSAKSGIDNLIKSKETTNNTYDTQILNIDIQINSALNSQKNVQTSIDNIKSNTLWSYTAGVDIQKNQTESQIQSTKTSLNGIEEQIQALKSQEQIQINQLNSQLTQLNSSLNTININLTSQSIYAGTSGTVKEKSSSLWNKVASNTLLCQILPNKSSLKLQVYSSSDLVLPVDIVFEKDGKKYTTQITTKLPYQDSVTQNYVYETASEVYDWDKKIDISTLVSEGKVFDVSTIWDDWASIWDTIYIPLHYVVNTINNSYVKVKTSSWEIKNQDIVLWELNSSQIEVRSWLHFWETICR